MLKSASYVRNNVLIEDGVNSTLAYCKTTTGVDLSVKNFYSFGSAGYISTHGTQVAKYLRLPTTPLTGADEKAIGWFLPKGDYICELNEGCKLADDDVGYIILRSSLNRNGVSLTSAVWDPGFTTKGKDGVQCMSVRLTVTNPHGVYIEQNARVGQLLVFSAAEGTEVYSSNGHQFQGTGLK